MGPSQISPLYTRVKEVIVTIIIILINIIITVFMVNQAFCEDTFDGDFGQQLKKGMDELLIVKLWKKGATTEVRVNGVREGVPEFRYELCFYHGLCLKGKPWSCRHPVRG